MAWRVGSMNSLTLCDERRVSVLSHYDLYHTWALCYFYHVDTSSKIGHNVNGRQ